MHWDAKEIFKLLPFYDTYIEKPEIKKTEKCLMKASEIVIKELFKNLLVELKGFKYQITLCVLLSKVKSSDLIEYDQFNSLNSLTKTVIGNNYFLDQ